MLEERRLSKRAIANLKTEFIAGSNIYTGVVENFCVEGVCLTADTTDTARDFIPGTPIKLKLQIPSGETLDLHCLIIWLHTCRVSPHGLINRMGIKIVDPPMRYKEFYRSL